MSGQSSYSIATENPQKLVGLVPEIKVGEILEKWPEVWRCLKTFRFMLQP